MQWQREEERCCRVSIGSVIEWQPWLSCWSPPLTSRAYLVCLDVQLRVTACAPSAYFSTRVCVYVCVCICLVMPVQALADGWAEDRSRRALTAAAFLNGSSSHCSPVTNSSLRPRRHTADIYQTPHHLHHHLSLPPCLTRSSSPLSHHPSLLSSVSFSLSLLLLPSSPSLIPSVCHSIPLSLPLSMAWCAGTDECVCARQSECLC